MRCLLPTTAFLVVTVLMHANVQAQESNVPPEMKILKKMLGTWKVEETSQAGKWTAKKSSAYSVAKRELVLGGRFVQEKVSVGADGKSTNIGMYTYDPEKKTYRWWFFDSQGHASEFTGTWDEKKQTLRFTGKPGLGVTGVITYRFLDANTIRWKYVVKDPGGEVGIQMEGKSVRQK